ESRDRKRQTDQNAADETWRDDSRERSANDPHQGVKNEGDGESNGDPPGPEASRAESGCDGEQDQRRDIDGEPRLVGEVGSGVAVGPVCGTGTPEPFVEEVDQVRRRKEP